MGHERLWQPFRWGPRSRHGHEGFACTVAPIDVALSLALAISLAQVAPGTFGLEQLHCTTPASTKSMA
jgi:hypothetical protein